MGYEKKLMEAFNRFPRVIHAEWGGSSHVGRFCQDHGVLPESRKDIPNSAKLSGSQPFYIRNIKATLAWPIHIVFLLPACVCVRVCVLTCPAQLE